MKIVLVSYYWPPASSVGVRRWVRFSEALIAEGHEITVFCPSNASYPMEDYSNNESLKKVKLIRVPIIEWRRIYAMIQGKWSKPKIVRKSAIDNVFQKKSKKKSLVQKLAVWVRANLVLPDARAPWIRPCAKALRAYLSENEADIVISTGPPHTCHMIALKVKKNMPEITWLADFRDPWTGGSYFSMLPLTAWGLRRHQKLEKAVLENADCSVTVSWSWADQLSLLGAKKVRVVTNGFTAADFYSDVVRPDSTKIVFSHVGTLLEDRNFENFWIALSELNSEAGFGSKRLGINLIGLVSNDVKETIAKAGIFEYTRIHGVVNHREAIKMILNTDILLLFVNNAADNRGRIPAKVYEYMAARKPIILIGPPEGDIHKIIKNGLFFIDWSESDIEKIKAVIISALACDSLEFDTESLPYEQKNISLAIREVIENTITNSQL